MVVYLTKFFVLGEIMVAKCLETFDFDVHPAQPLHLRVIQRSMTVIFLFFFPRGFF